MSWIDDIVKIRPPDPSDEGVYNALGLAEVSASYDEYRMRCACAGVEPLFTRAEFDCMKRRSRHAV